MMMAADAALARRAVENLGRRPLGRPTFSSSYDLESDTPMVYFAGRPVPAVSHPVDDGDQHLFCLVLDPETDETVGLHIDGFLAWFLGVYPEFERVLETATLLELSRDELTESVAEAKDCADG